VHMNGHYGPESQRRRPEVDGAVEVEGSAGREDSECVRHGVVEESNEGVKEEWRDVPGLPRFIASSYGRVAKLVDSPSAGYFMICARQPLQLREDVLAGSKNTSSSGFRIYSHHVVGLTFLGKPPKGKEQINHKDGNRQNNRPDNIEWSNQAWNVRHGWLYSEKRKDKLRKYSVEQYREAQQLYAMGLYIYDQIGRHMGIDGRVVGRMVHSERIK